AVIALGLARQANMTCNLLNSLLLYRRNVRTPASSGTEKIVGRRLLDKERHCHAPQAVRAPRPRTQYTNITATTKASPYQVIAYCTCSLRKFTVSGPARGNPPGGCGLSNSM